MEQKLSSFHKARVFDNTIRLVLICTVSLWFLLEQSGEVFFGCVARQFFSRRSKISSIWLLVLFLEVIAIVFQVNETNRSDLEHSEPPQLCRIRFHSTLSVVN